MNDVTIEVTQEDIDNGKRGCKGACPIARAVKRTLRNFKQPVVGNSALCVGRKSRRKYVASLPRVAREFIVNYDGTEPKRRGLDANGIRPFSFTITVPSEYAP